MNDYNYHPDSLSQETTAQPDNNNGTYEVPENEFADLLPFSDCDDMWKSSESHSRLQVAVSPSGAELLPPHHVLVKCHLYDNPSKCRLWDKYQNLKLVEDEASVLSRNSWLETAWLYDRVRQLETVLKKNAIPIPPEEEWPFEGHCVTDTDE